MPLTHARGVAAPGRAPRRAAVLLLALALACGSPERRIVVESDPPGALVRLDGSVIGQTPLEHEFEHYGRRRLTLYLDGHRTWSKRIELDAPWHETFPLDVFTQVLLPLSLEYEERIFVALSPAEGDEVEPDISDFVERATALHTSERASIAPKPEPDTEPEER